MTEKGSLQGLTRKDFIKTVGIGIGTLEAVGIGAGALQLTGCGGSPGVVPVSWPISNQVFTTAQRQVLPVALTASTPQIGPGDVAQYAQYGYSAWNLGGPLQPALRTELAPSYRGAPAAVRLLSFFSISDIHIADKESPAQALYVGWNAPYGPSSSGLSSAYSPILLSTPHVLDAAIQTINALHQTVGFDFGLSLGDACNNTQYNELRWFIDTIDGKLIQAQLRGAPGPIVHRLPEALLRRRTERLDSLVPGHRQPRSVLDGLPV